MTQNMWEDKCKCGHKREDHFQSIYTNHCLIQNCSCHWFTLEIDGESDDSDGDFVAPLDGDDDLEECEWED